MISVVAGYACQLGLLEKEIPDRKVELGIDIERALPRHRIADRARRKKRAAELEMLGARHVDGAVKREHRRRVLPPMRDLLGGKKRMHDSLLIQP